MTDYQTIKVLTDQRGVVRVILDRPDKRNALSGLMITELSNCFAVLSTKCDARAVILSSTCKTFCAGGDLDWMKQQMLSDREGRMREARRLADMLRRLNELPLPVIARVDGDAFGGGVGLLCACDVVIAAETTRFGLTETRLGLIPATIGPYVIARLGEGRARQVFMSGRIFNAVEAVALGVVSKCVSAEELDSAIEQEVVPYLATSRTAVGAAKALVRALGLRIDNSVIEDTIERLADTWETEDAKAGIEAFITRQPAPWTRGSA